MIACFICVLFCMCRTRENLLVSRKRKSKISANYICDRNGKRRDVFSRCFAGVQNAFVASGMLLCTAAMFCAHFFIYADAFEEPVTAFPVPCTAFLQSFPKDGRSGRWSTQPPCSEHFYFCYSNGVNIPNVLLLYSFVFLATFLFLLSSYYLSVFILYFLFSCIFILYYVFLSFVVLLSFVFLLSSTLRVFVFVFFFLPFHTFFIYFLSFLSVLPFFITSYFLPLYTSLYFRFLFRLYFNVMSDYSNIKLNMTGEFHYKF